MYAVRLRVPMTHHIGDQLDGDAIDAFLNERGLGVLGLAADGRAYTFPIAFAADSEAERCLFRFVMANGSRKREYLSETETASLTVYEWNGPEDWRSVVIHGALSPVDDGELAHVAALFSDVGPEAALDVFNRSLSAYDTEWWQLDVAEVTGRGSS